MRKSKKRAARCDVALLVDIETGERGPSGKFVVNCGSVEELLYRCLRTLYESAVIVPFDPKLTPTIAELRALKPRVVFNITEWVDGERRPGLARRDHGRIEFPIASARSRPTPSFPRFS